MRSQRPTPLQASLTAAFSVLVLALTGVDSAAQCPIRRCNAGAGGSSSLLQLGDRPEGQTPCKEVSEYDVTFLPGHFICMKCDWQACPDCGVLCDLSSCVGEFYTQECWCEGGSGTGKSLFCDEKCGGGLCDSKDEVCRPKQEGCKPWWSCGNDPPASFLQEGSSRQSLLRQGSTRGALQRKRASNAAAAKVQTGVHAQATREAAERLQVVRQQQRQRQQSVAKAGAKLPSELNMLHFANSRYECFSGALPPKTRDADGILWIERGYLVLDAQTCSGAGLTQKCFCWDEFLRLKGADPLTSELECDAGCGAGSCAGKTCSAKPPTLLSSVAQDAPREPHYTEHEMVVHMVPLE